MFSTAHRSLSELWLLSPLSLFLLLLCCLPAYPYTTHLPACLQPSLTGTGAKVAIICNVTPASSQSDETWNTLRFADGAKRIKVS